MSLAGNHRTHNFMVSLHQAKSSFRTISLSLMLLKILFILQNEVNSVLHVGFRIVVWCVKCHTVNKSDMHTRNEVNISNLLFSSRTLLPLQDWWMSLLYTMTSFYKVVLYRTFHMTLSINLWGSLYLFSVEIKDLCKLAYPSAFHQ